MKNHVFLISVNTHFSADISCRWIKNHLFIHLIHSVGCHWWKTGQDIQCKDRICNISFYKADIALLNNTMLMLMTKLEDREKWQWYKSHDVILAATMNHLDIVISSMCVQVFGINAARKGTFSLDMVDLSCLRRGLRRLEKKAIKTGFELSVSHPLELKGLGATVVLEKDLLHLIISRPVLDQTPFNLYELLTRLSFIERKPCA